MRKSVWVSFIALVVLVVAASAPAPAVAVVSSQSEAPPASSGSWVVDQYTTLLSWLGHLVHGLEPSGGDGSSSLHDGSEDSPPQGDASISSSGCELEGCTEAGVTIDPDG